MKQVRLHDDTYQMLIDKQKGLEFPISITSLANGILKFALIKDKALKKGKKREKGTTLWATGLQN